VFHKGWHTKGKVWSFNWGRVSLRILVFLSASVALLFCIFTSPVSFAAQKKAFPDQRLAQLVERLGAAKVTFPKISQILNKLMWSSVDAPLSNRFAAFSSESNTIVFSSKLFDVSSTEQLVVLTHELGHAFVHQMLSPDELNQWSSKYGPWENLGSLENVSLKDKKFLERHPESEKSSRQIFALRNTPSRYALSNRHEWLAECFASWVAGQIKGEKLNYVRPVDNELAKAFQLKLK
jgi:hypothetical protein